MENRVQLVNIDGKSNFDGGLITIEKARERNQLFVESVRKFDYLVVVASSLFMLIIDNKPISTLNVQLTIHNGTVKVDLNMVELPEEKLSTVVTEEEKQRAIEFAPKLAVLLNPVQEN